MAGCYLSPRRHGPARSPARVPAAQGGGTPVRGPGALDQGPVNPHE